MWKFKTPNFRLIKCISWLIEIMKKILINILDDLIDSQFLFDQSKRQIWSIERNSWLVEILINSSQTLGLTWTILDCYSIDWKGAFDRSMGILDQSKLVKLNFSEFSPSSFQWFVMDKLSSYEHNRLSLRPKLNSIDAIVLKFNLTYLISNLNNIITSICFYKTVISTTMYKINCRIF